MPEHDDDALRALPIFRELEAEIRRAAAREDERLAVVGSAVRRRRRFARFATTRPGSGAGESVADALRPHPGRVAGAAVAVAALTAVAIVGPGLGSSGPALDPVASASAALSPRDGIVHLVMTGGPVNADGTPRTTIVGEVGHVGTVGRRVELWSASDPDRFAQHTDVTSRDGNVIGTVETGIAGDGRAWTTDFGTGAVSVTRDPVGDDTAFLTPEQASVAPGEAVRAATDQDREPASGGEKDTDGDREAGGDATPGVLSPQAGNAAAGVERLLRDDTFREESRGTVDGHDAIVLVATRTGRPASNPDASPPPDLQVRYVVDARSFEPVRIDRSYRSRDAFGPNVPQADRDRIAAQNPGWVLFSRLTVDRYERLPATRATARVFDVPAGPSPALPRTFAGHTTISRYLTEGTRTTSAAVAARLRSRHASPAVDPESARTVPDPAGSGTPWTVFRTGSSICLLSDSSGRLCGTRTGLARSGAAVEFNDPQPGDPGRGGDPIVVRGLAVDDVTEVALLDKDGHVIDRAAPTASVFRLRAPAGTDVLAMRVTGRQGRVSTQRLR
jgi:hypothetical protein